ncbi:MAG TPA: hypothetical protein VGX70_23055 [Gemmataceae bacterium]|nr:hypothetical protein [Gemmataceae bacterium]
MLLIATGFLALAYHIGSQCGSSIPLEPPAYDAADLAPPTPIVEELPLPVPATGARECDEPAPINSPQPVSSISRKIRIVSVDAAPLEPKPNEIIVPAAGVEKEPAKIEDSQDLPLTHEEIPQPVSKRRSVEEDEVAWHVVETPGSKPNPGSSTGATLFREPASLGHSDEGGHHEAMSSEIVPRRIRAEPASPQRTAPQSRGPITVPASAPLPEKATRLEEKKPAMDPSPATKSQKIEPSRVPSTVSPAQAIPALKIDPPTVKQESKVKATSQPSAHSSPISAAATQSSAVSKPPVLAESSMEAKSDKGTALKGDLPRSRPRKARIVGLTPLPSKVTAESASLKARIRDLEPKSATWPPPLVSLPPANAKFSSMEPARELTHSKPKVKELPPLSFKPRIDSIPIISAPKEPTASLQPVSASAIVPVVHKVQVPLEKIKVVSSEKSAAPSLGEVFLPPAELPASVTSAASELATQRLISRSLNSSTGVAARLASASRGLSGPDGSALILAGGHSGAESSADGEGSRSATGTVHFTATKEEIAAGAHLDYVTSGVVILGDTFPAIASSEMTPPAQQELLKNAIRAACGAQVSDLDVSLERNHSLRIRLKVPREAEPDLRQTILALPALADYKVHLNIQVSP